MSWQCTSWALREASCPSASARLILIALADRCQPDGRSAWPTIKTLMAEAHCSERTVRRSLSELEESGAIRRGNQDLAQRDEHGQYLVPQYRPVVWECCIGVALEPVAQKPGSQARQERANRASGQEPAEEPGVQTCQNGSAGKPQNSNDSQTCQNGSAVTGNTPGPDASDMSGTATSGRPYKETNNLTNTPSRSPHGGSARQTEDQDGPSESARELNRMFAALLVEHGLEAPPRSDRGHASDLDAARTLLDGRPPGEVLAVASWAMTDPFWRSNALTLVALKRNWSQIALQRSRPGAPGARPEHLVPARREVSEADIMRVMVRLDFDDRHYPAAKKHVVAGLRAGLADERIIADWQADHQGEGEPSAVQHTGAEAAAIAGGYHFAGNLRPVEGGA
ncbi:MAG: helix-turn-helix domain-containing protein [Bifidobacterium sp.]|jgi:hypothetical protein|uniref:helix-turn-helix domain-containing protein n=1 Tax=Bifidobacterium sp. TaxID=41200 RepID=UPI0039EB4C05